MLKPIHIFAAGFASFALALGIASAPPETPAAEPPAKVKKEELPALPVMPLMPRAGEPFKMPTPEQFKAMALEQQRRENNEIVASMVQKPATAEDIQIIQEHLVPPKSTSEELTTRRTWLELVRFNNVKIYVIHGGGKTKDAIKVSLPTSTVYRNVRNPVDSLLVTNVWEETPLVAYKTASLKRKAEELLKAATAVDGLYQISIEKARKKYVKAPGGTPEWQAAANQLNALYQERTEKINELTKTRPLVNPDFPFGQLELLSLEKRLVETPVLSPSSFLPEVAYHRNGAIKGEDKNQILDLMAFLNPPLRGKDTKTLEVTTLGSLWDSGNHYLVVPTVYPHIHPATKKTFWAEAWTHERFQIWNKSASGMYENYYKAAFLQRGALKEVDEGISTTAHEVYGHGGKFALQSLHPHYDKIDALLEQSLRRGQVLDVAIDPKSKYSLTNGEEHVAQLVGAFFSATARPRLVALDEGRPYRIVQMMDQAAREVVAVEKAKARAEEMKKIPMMPRIPEGE